MALVTQPTGVINDRGDNQPFLLEQADTPIASRMSGNPNGKDYTTVHGSALPRYQTAPSAPPPAPPGPLSVPGAPELAMALTTPGSGVVTISFFPPASNGGSPITGYVVVDESNGVRQNVASSPATISGLTKGRAASFAVQARNAVGLGPCSAVSRVVYP